MLARLWSCQALAEKSDSYLKHLRDSVFPQLEDIKGFQFQTQPYQYVTFKNVSLKPDFKTDVQIEVEKGVLEIVPVAMVGTWFFDNPRGDEEQMAVFQDGRVVVLYSNGHRDETLYENGFIKLAEYGNAKCKMEIKNSKLLQYFNQNKDEKSAKTWKLIDPKPHTNLLRSLTGEKTPKQKPKAARKLKIVVYEGGKEPEVTLNIPLTALKIANGLLPPKVKSQMLAQGINLEEILKQVDEGLEPTTLLDVKDGSEHVIISLE